MTLYWIYVVVISVLLLVGSVNLFFRTPVLTSRQNNLARFSLWFFILCNVLAEYCAFFIQYRLQLGNEFIYSYSIVLHSAALFVFYSLVVRKKLMHIVCLAGWMAMTVGFFMEGYWRPGSNIYVFHVGAYYTIMAIASLLFLWYNFKDKESRKNKFLLRLGTLLSVYFSIAFTLIPVNFILENYAAKQFFMYAASIMNTVYYTVFALLLLFNLNVKHQHASRIL